MLGRPIVKEGGPLRGLYPPVSTEKHDPVLSELARLEVPIPQPRRIVLRRNERVTVPEDTLRQLRAERGRRIYPVLRSIETAPGWATIPDEQQREILEDTIRRVLRTVRP
ncbi:MAG: hypothetical protein ACRDFW_11545 [bacterium]